MVPFARGDCWGDLVAYWKPGLWWWGWEANEKLFCILYMCVDHVECIKIRDGRYEKFPVYWDFPIYTDIFDLPKSSIYIPRKTLVSRHKCARGLCTSSV